jgi:hypothetical protein
VRPEPRRQPVPLAGEPATPTPTPPLTATDAVSAATVSSQATPRGSAPEPSRLEPALSVVPPAPRLPRVELPGYAAMPATSATPAPVQVRIGTVEIRATPPPAPTPAPAPAARRPAAPRGFDAYRRARSHERWEL